jgi:hypothetical protein
MTDQNQDDGSIASRWQQQIEGEWYGNPSVFDPEGNHTGWIKVARSSVFEDGTTTYFMDTRFDNVGPLRNRLEVSEFAFGLKDSDTNRIYMGPDFIGAGHPYGTLVDAHYYSPGWRADLRTMVHILADNETQVYSSLLFDGPTICAVFNGVYQVAFDYETNAATKTRIDDFCALERQAGKKPHDIPAKQPGTWAGELLCYGADQELAGKVDVSIRHDPTSLLRARQTVEIDGLISKRYSFDRYHDGNRHTYDGPDLYGNAIAYGRALYTTQHAYGEAWKIQGREFLYDDQQSLSACWKLFDGDRLDLMMYGSLAWTGD